MATREVVLHNILLYLQKAYSELDMDRCIKILAGYGVIPRALWILRTYWGQITMVEKDRG